MYLKIPFISSIIHYFKTFHHFIGKKLILLVLIMTISGMTEGIGITLFLPFLTEVNLSTRANDQISRFYYKFFEFLGLPLSINSVLFSIILFFTMKFLIQAGQGIFISRIISEQTRKLQENLISILQKMDYRYFLNSNTGFLNNLVVVEVQRSMISFRYYCDVLVNIIFIGIYLFFSFLINWQITTLAAMLGSIIFYLLNFFSRFSRKFSYTTSQKNASLQNELIQAIHNYKYLKSTETFSNLKKRLFKHIKILVNLEYKLLSIRYLLRALPEFIAIFLVIGLILFQISILNKSITSIIIIGILFYRTMNKIAVLQGAWQTFCSFAGGIDTLSNFHKDVSNNLEKTGEKKVTNFNKGIKIKQLNFSYNDKPVLIDIDIFIPKNKIIALVGESGSGKSTLVDIIAGLLKPKSGEIFFDDINYKDIDMSTLREKIGYVTQEGVVFNDTIANNISFCELSTDSNNPEFRERIEYAAKMAYCDKFIMTSSNNYETLVGDRGIKLSGGQRQRLAVARELFKETEILILDEATSALDSESEFYIQESIKKLKGNKTLIIIAHRLSTVKNCDYIYVMHKGRIFEEGNFSELYNKKESKFREMCEMQSF